MPTTPRDFRLLWAGEAVSALGSQFTILAVPTLAILRLGAGPVQVGALTGLGFAGYPVAALLTGPLVDRLARRPLLLATNALRAAVLLGIAAATFSGKASLWQLGAASVVLSAATAVFDSAYQVLIPTVVPVQQLARANAQLETTQSVAYFAGPSAAGFVIQAVGTAFALLADALSYVVAFATVLLVGTRGAAAARPRTRYRTDLADGVRAFRTYRFLTPIVCCVAMSNAGGMMVRTILLLTVYRAFALSPAAGGWILAVGGLSGIAGAAIAGAAGRRLGVVPALTLATFVEGAAWCITPLGLVVSPLAVLLAASAVSGFMTPIWNVNNVTLRQRAVPLQIQARVVALARAIGIGVIPVGTMLGGGVAAVLTGRLGTRAGLVGAMFIGGAVAASSAVALVIGRVAEAVLELGEPDSAAAQ